jgi:sulfur-oxidizing protein SoxY
MNQLRRTFLKGAALAGTVAVAAAAGLLAPMRLLAAERSKAFDAKGLPDTLKSLGAASVTDSKDITIKAPHVAENGAMIPVEITSTIPGTTAIILMVEKNPSPMVAQFDFTNGGEAYVSTRIKMGQTSTVKAIAKAGDKFYAASKEIKVTIGGCGG